MRTFERLAAAVVATSTEIAGVGVVTADPVALERLRAARAAEITDVAESLVNDEIVAATRRDPHAAHTLESP